MKVTEHANFNDQFPEAYTWGRIDSIKFSELAGAIVNHIEHDLRTPHRLNTPGLRLALNLIAERADI